ncbi:MAG: hypothetical protein ACLQU5_08110 [Isosphaeraceae bacterium]
MYDLVFESLRKSTESAIQVQQEMFRTWGNFWGGGPARVQSIQKWADTFGDLLKKQKETLEAQYNGGLKIIEQALTVHTTKELEELRAKLISEWKKNLEVQRQVAEAQMRALLTAQVEWVEDASKVMTWNWWLVDMDAPFAGR